MQRLLHEGMDAGLCGFSIQRLGPNSVQADFDGTPMVTDTMTTTTSSAWPRCCRARRGLHPDHAIHRRPIRTTRRPGLEDGRPRSPSGRSSTTCSRRRGSPDPPGRSTGRGRPSEGPADLRPGRHLASGFAFSLDNWNLYDQSPAWREATTGTSRTSCARCATPSCASGSAGRPTRRRRCSSRPRTRSAVRPASWSCSGVDGRPELRQYVGKSLGQIAEEEGKARHRRDARSLHRHRPEGGVPR